MFEPNRSISHALCLLFCSTLLGTSTDAAAKAEGASGRAGSRREQTAADWDATASEQNTNSRTSQLNRNKNRKNAGAASKNPPFAARDPIERYDAYRKAREDGDEKTATRAIQEAFILREKIALDNPIRHRIVGAEAGLLLRLGYTKRAEEHLREEQRLLTESFGPNHRITMGNTSALAAVVFALGRYAEARYLSEQLVDASEVKSLSSTKLDALKRLALIHFREGAFEKAASFAKRLKNARSKKFGEDRAPTLRASLLHARSIAKLGRTTEANQKLAEIMKAARRALGKGHPLLAELIEEHGALLHSISDYAAAEKAFRVARNYHLREYGEDDIAVVRIGNRLAESLYRQGRLIDAERLYRKTLSSAEFLAKEAQMLEQGALHEDTQVAISSFGLSKVLLASKNWRSAPKLLKKTRSWIFERQVDSIFKVHTIHPDARIVIKPREYESVVYSSALASNDMALITLALNSAFSFKQPRRAAEVELRNVLSNSRDKAISAAARSASEKRADLSNAIAHGGDVAQKHQELAYANERLSRRLGAYGTDRFAMTEFTLVGQAERSAALGDVRKALPRSSALIEFRRFQRMDFADGDLAEERILAIYLRGRGAPKIFDLGVHSEIEKLVRAATDFESNREQRQAATHALSDRLLAPLTNFIRDVETLYLAPDGVLNFLPFDILPFEGAEHLIEVKDVRFLTSGRVLAHQRGAPAARGLLALGGVDFDRDGGASRRNEAPSAQYRHLTVGASRATGLEEFTALSESEPEIREIASLFEKKIGEPARVLTGASAHEAALKASQPPRVLHIASHGFFQTGVGDSARDPMMRSGLALAGANRGVKGALGASGEDGVLWAIEAIDLSLQGTQLVTLSACDTAQGVLDAGEGVYGLGRALQIAGAENVLLTLWYLDDYGARDFMGHFYETWLSSDERDLAKALRSTKLAWIGSSNPLRSEPEFWAPYILIGSGP